GAECVSLRVPYPQPLDVQHRGVDSNARVPIRDGNGAECVSLRVPYPCIRRFLHPKPETLSPKRNPKPEARSPKRNPKPEARSPKRNPKPEARNSKPEARNPKHEARKPKPETRNPKPSRSGESLRVSASSRPSQVYLHPKPETR
ncbi:hypothetical protein T484DRAFT_1922734, partial [Baffinella frigidus]